MARFHVNPSTGNTGPCKASKMSCPHGGESGEENHYGSEAEAQGAAETLMASKYKEVYNGYRKGETAGLDLSQAAKKHLISEAAAGNPLMTPAVIGRVLSQDKDELVRKHVAENLKSQKLLRDMAGDESARVRKAVALNTNNRDVLARLTTDPDASVRNAAIANPKTPVKARKAAQAAIKAANIANLQKASRPEASGKASSIDTGAGKHDSELRAERAVKALEGSSATAEEKASIWSGEGKSNSELRAKRAESVLAQVKQRSDDQATKNAITATDAPFTPNQINKTRLSVANAHFVDESAVEIDRDTAVVNVKKADGTHVYNYAGEKVGVVSKEVASNMSKVRERYRAQVNRAGDRGRASLGLQLDSKLGEGLRKAHGFSDKVKIVADGPLGVDRKFRVTADDGKTYTYAGSNLELLKVENEAS